MEKRNRIIAAVSMALAVVLVGLLVNTMVVRGKDSDDLTNKSDDMTAIDRGEEDAVSEDTISYDGVTVSFSLPDNFYFDSEFPDLDSGIRRSYMSHNYDIMADVCMYKVHTQTVGLIDEENSENSVIYHDMEITADEWLREMRMVYLDRDDEADVKEAAVGDNTIKYFTRIKKNDQGINQGMVVGVITLDDTHYYCVKIVEFDKENEPEFSQYQEFFTLNQ